MLSPSKYDSRFITVLAKNLTPFDGLRMTDFWAFLLFSIAPEASPTHH